MGGKGGGDSVSKVKENVKAISAVVVFALATGLVFFTIPVRDARMNRAPVFKPANTNFWPDGKSVAVSLSFDDARPSQVDVGIPILNKYHIKGTFFVLIPNVNRRLNLWKQAVADGHEIGNHTSSHPVSGNFIWATSASENYSIEEIKEDILRANKSINEALGVTPVVFAYPSGAKSVGRGRNVQSYVPIIADLFLAGRGWRDEGVNDPSFCDMAQLMGTQMDGQEFSDIIGIIENARKSGSWMILAGHQVGGSSGGLTVEKEMLEKLCRYLADPANGVWVAPVGTVAEYVRDHRVKQ